MNYDAIIVLAHEMNSEGILNDESSLRASLAFDIFRRQKSSCIVTSGWNYRDDCIIKIADAFKDFIVKQNEVNPISVKVEPNARDTVGDAYFTKVNLAIPLMWKSICVVTSLYHVDRTREIFKFIYGNDNFIDVIGAKVLNAEGANEHEIASTNAFRKTFFGVRAGDTTSIYKRMIGEHPYYKLLSS